jgi:hypothetical protein
VEPWDLVLARSCVPTTCCRGEDVLAYPADVWSTVKVDLMDAETAGDIGAVGRRHLGSATP